MLSELPLPEDVFRSASGLVQDAKGLEQAAGKVIQDAEGLELATVLSGLGQLVATAWATVTAPFMIFGDDMAVSSVLFILAFTLLAWNIVTVPKQ